MHIQNKYSYIRIYTRTKLFVYETIKYSYNCMYVNYNYSYNCMFT